jgi:hypothetical protein
MFLVACNSQTGDSVPVQTGSISAQVIWASNDTASPDTVRGAVAVGPGTTLPSNLATVRIIVTGPGIATPIQADFAASAPSDTITGIPAGTNRTVTVHGLNSGNYVAYQGTTTDIVVNANASTHVTVTAIEVVNDVPTASSVSITDDNGGNAFTGDGLTGNYTYDDVNGDVEGVSTFRWLRNGASISHATSLIYVVVAADVGTSLTFEVTPVAVSGLTTGAPVTSEPLDVLVPGPVVSGMAIHGHQLQRHR